MRKMIKSCEDSTCFEPEGIETESDTMFSKRNIARDFYNF